MNVLVRPFHPQPHEHHELRIKSIRVHPDFDRQTFDHDLAVVEMRRSAAALANVEPICIAAAAAADRLGGGGPLAARLTGWGVTQAGRQSLTLKEVDVRTLPPDECRALFAPGTITDSMLCAWDKNEHGTTTGDSCTGDSGGEGSCSLSRSLVCGGFDVFFSRAGLVPGGYGRTQQVPFTQSRHQKELKGKYYNFHNSNQNLYETMNE